MSKRIEDRISDHSPHWRGRGTPPPPPTTSIAKNDVFAGIQILSAVLLTLSLASYQPTDPSLNTASSIHSPVHNFVGVSGAYVSDIALQLFGLAAYGVIFLLLVGAYRGFAQQGSSQWKKSFIRSTTWIVLLSALFEWTHAKSSFLPAHPYSPGGVLGLLLAEQFRFWLGRQGGSVALFSVFLVVLWWVLPWNGHQVREWAIRTSPKVLHLLSIVRTRVFTLMKSGWNHIVQLSRDVYSFSSGANSSTPKESVPVVHSPTPTVTPQPSTALTLHPSREDVIDVTPSGEFDPLLKEAPHTVRPHVELDHAEREAGAVRAPFVDDAQYELPQFTYLDDPPPTLDPAHKKETFLENARILIQKLKAFQIEGTVDAICPGPVITMYEFAPQEGVKISKIANLADDLSLALSAESVRIIAPIPGKSVVGIEIPNEDRETITLKEILLHSQFQESKYRIPLALGKDISGETFVADLYQMPHVLVAGSTGSGKSVFINTSICSLLYKFTPSQLKMILIDPKMVELSVYDQIPHLLLPVVTDSQKAGLALQWAVEEMERRYELMHELQVRNIESYNRKIQQGLEPSEEIHLEHAHLPMVVIVVDELADLMMTSPKDVEVSICRLAQKARAAGIHLIVATQRPDTSVITGTIKANFPSRISFRVSSRVDSATILDDKGAEKLLGRGDMLVRLMGMSRITRLHGAFVREKEVEKIVAHVRLQGEPTYDESILMPRDEGPQAQEEDLDEVYDQALDVVSRERVASISLVQRRLRIGYNRAARIIETMERQGIIGPSDGTSRARKVLIPPPPSP